MKRTAKGTISPRELEVVAAWWHTGTVKDAAEIMDLAPQTAKNLLAMARLRTGHPNTLTLARAYSSQLPSVATLRRRVRERRKAAA